MIMSIERLRMTVVEDHSHGSGSPGKATSKQDGMFLPSEKYLQKILTGLFNWSNTHQSIIIFFMAQHKYIAPETEAALTDLNEQTLPEISRMAKFNTKSIQDNTASIARLENENR